MKTQSNSRPLAEWIVISWIASCPACAWLSPASSEAWVRKAASGDMISPVSASGTRRGGAMISPLVTISAPGVLNSALPASPR